MAKQKGFLTNIKEFIETKSGFSIQDIAEISNITGIGSFLVTTMLMKRMSPAHPPKQIIDYVTKVGLSISWTGWSGSSMLKSTDRFEQDNDNKLQDFLSYGAIGSGVLSIAAILVPRILPYSPINCMARKFSLSALILDGTAQNIKEFNASSSANTLAVFSSLISKEPRVMLMHKKAGDVLGKAASSGWSASGILNSTEQVSNGNMTWTNGISATTGFMCYHSIARSKITPMEYNHLSLSLTSLLSRAVDARSTRLHKVETNGNARSI